MNGQEVEMAYGDSAAGHDLVGSMRDAASRRLAAGLVKEGYAVGGFVRAVCGIWADASNEAAMQSLYRIKGERRVGRPISGMLSTAEFVRLLDPYEIAPELWSVVLDPEELEARFGSLGFMRAPVKRETAEALPPSAVSRTPDGTYWLQNYISMASEPVHLLGDEMLAQGVGCPSATSMNVSGQPEIVDQDEGIEFCRAHGMPLFLADAEDSGRVRGSFPIVSVERSGLRLLREGQFPGDLMKYLFSCDVDMSATVPSKYPMVRTHGEESVSAIPAHRLHDEIVACLDGKEVAI